MLKARITKKSIKQHFDYLGWMYIVIPIVLTMFWSLIYTFTEYRPSDEKVLSLYMTASYVDPAQMDLLALKVTSEFPQIEEFDFLPIPVEDAYDYANMQRLMTLIYAAQGDVYILDTEMFDRFVLEGMFIPLDGLVDTDIDVSATTVKLEEEETEHVYGIPADALYGFLENEQYDHRRTVIVAMAYTTNPEESAQLIQWLVDNRQGEKPTGFDQWEPRQPFYPEEEEELLSADGM